MKYNICTLFCASVLVLGTQGCTLQVNPIPSHTEPITTISNKQTLIQEIDGIIASANYEINQNHWREANTYLKNGLAALGNNYLNSSVQDDSSMKLVVADDFERKGLLEQAARLRLKMLQGRLDQFKSNS